MIMILLSNHYLMEWKCFFGVSAQMTLFRPRFWLDVWREFLKTVLIFMNEQTQPNRKFCVKAAHFKICTSTQRVWLKQRVNKNRSLKVCLRHLFPKWCIDFFFVLRLMNCRNSFEISICILILIMEMPCFEPSFTRTNLWGHGPWLSTKSKPEDQLGN